jgi:hypothetical protein
MPLKTQMNMSADMLLGYSVIGYERAIPALENALNDLTDYVHKGAEQALKCLI